MAYAYRTALIAPTIDRYLSERANIAFLNADNIFTGDNTFHNITIMNVSSYNVTGNVNASGTIEGSEICITGQGCFSTFNISNFINDAGYITSADDNVSSSELDDLCSTNGKILKRVGGAWQCADDETGGGGDGDSDNTMYINFESSEYNVVYWNITQAEDTHYSSTIRGGRHFVFGEEV